MAVTILDLVGLQTSKTSEKVYMRHDRLVSIRLGMANFLVKGSHPENHKFEEPRISSNFKTNSLNMATVS